MNYSSFKALKKYKNIHKGQRFFIVATGPSLRAEDLNLLKDEITFSMNSIFNMFDKTSWRPNYYCMVDGGVYEKLKHTIDNQPLGCCFIDSLTPWHKEGINKIPIIPTLCNTNLLREKLTFLSKKSQTSANIVTGTYIGTSVVHVITQICFYMGFSEIYYIGTDCSNFLKHAEGCDHNVEISRSESSISQGIKADYISDYKYAKKHGVKMYNATRGGALEIFPRVKLEEVLS